MALTPAERAKRYRDKLKNNPEKAEEVRKKQLARMKTKRKKVSEMTEKEKIEHRKKWKEEKRKQRTDKSNKKLETPKTIPNNGTPKTSSNSHNKMRRILRRLRKQIQDKQDKITELTRKLEKQRKRHFRIQLKCNKMLEEKQKIIDKFKAREEFTEFTLRKTYENCEKKFEKEVLKRIIKNCKHGNKTYLAKLMGLRRTVRTKQKKQRITCCKDIEKFWLRNDVTRPTAGKKECKVRGKEKRQIKYTIDTIHNLHKKYKELGGKYGITTLWKYKPFYVIYPNLNSRKTCLCIKHANIDLKYKALQLYGPLKQKSLDDILNELTCDRQSYSCAANLCSQCKAYRVQYNKTKHDERQSVTWWEWERVDHEYVKKEGNESIRIKTKKTVKSLKRTSIKELQSAFDRDLIKYKKHVFVMKHQNNQYQTLINNLKENEALIICDFSENYECKTSEEVQALHFGASKQQVCLHTGAIFYKDSMQSFCTISENTGHRPENIWTHLNPILKEIRETKPDVNILHFQSDGPTSQYRQKGNFHLLNTLPKEMGFEYCTWSFSESGHGKSIADGIGGSVKRTIDKHVAYGVDATNASQIYYLLTKCFKTTKFFLVDDSQIECYSEKLQNLKTLTGTLNLHQIITLKNGKENEIKYRDLSCYCGDLKGYCLCFTPRYHLLKNVTHRDTNLRCTSALKEKCTRLLTSKPKPNLKSNHDDLKESIDQHEKATNASVILEDDLRVDNLMEHLDSHKIDNQDIMISREKSRSPSPVIEIIDLSQSAAMSPLCIQALLTDDPMLSSAAPQDKNDHSNIITSEAVVVENDGGNCTRDKNKFCNKENEPNKTNKPMKRKLKGQDSTIKQLKAGLKCCACNSQSVQVAKCIVCKLWYCSTCSGSELQIDLICETCLNYDVSDD